MKMLSFKLCSVTLAGGSAFAAMLVLTPPGSAGANPPRMPIRTFVRARPAAFFRAQLRPQGNVATPTPCTMQLGGGDSFIGVTAGGDVAGGDGTGVLGGNDNAACDENDGVGAGMFNTVGESGNAPFSFVAGGEYNDVVGQMSFIGGGIHGIITGNGSAIGAGDYLYTEGGGTTPGMQITGTDSFVGSGDQNVVSANDAFIGSGLANSISSTGSYATILGGMKNTASAEYASIIGGYGSTASGEYAIVAGGNTDTAAGELSFAAGYHADAVHPGSFVWSDFGSGSALVKDTAANQFVARASGGFYLYSNEAATTGVKLAPGSGVWGMLSDRNAKSGVAAVDDDSVLAKVASLPVNTWQYKTEAGVRHVGPMAQDFYAAFGVGEDDRHITSIDEDGVALAAIKGLDRKVERKGGELTALRAEVRAQHGDIDALRGELRHLEAELAARR